MEPKMRFWSFRHLPDRDNHDQEMNDQVDVKRAAVSDVERDRLRMSFTMSRIVTVVGKATSLGNSEGCAHGTKSDIGRCIGDVIERPCQ